MRLANPHRFPQPAIGMTPLSQLTRRNYLIAAHDALATAFALLASFYLRFEGGEAFYARLPLLLRILPLFVVFSVVICYVFNLTTTKWRFISLPDALNIMRVATCSDGRAHRAGLCLHFRRHRTARRRCCSAVSPSCSTGFSRCSR